MIYHQIRKILTVMSSPTLAFITTDKSYMISSTVDYWKTSYLVSSPFTTLSLPAENSTFDIPSEQVAFCEEWEAAQHNLFQTANIFFSAAFLVPRNFKQSLLLLRSLLSIGFVLSTLWAGMHVCAPDAFAWNLVLMFLNTTHMLLLTCRVLPPPLSIELTELFLKMFRPLRVSKKHFKEMTREGVIINLEAGGTYALQDVTPADEKLSILLKGKMKVTCDDMHMHYIYPHQFVDSPEWEASNGNDNTVFQVTITAEEDCLYIYWSRWKLDHIFRHRPLFKIVLTNIIGKDVTHKLYSLNEHLMMSNGVEGKSHHGDHWKKMNRSLSLDEVHTGTRGHVRSMAWRAQHHRRTSATLSNQSSPGLKRQEFWVPVVAKQFPATSPFSSISRTVNTTMTVQTMPLHPQLSTPNSNALPVIVPVFTTPASPLRNTSNSQMLLALRTTEREVKFETPV